VPERRWQRCLGLEDEIPLSYSMRFSGLPAKVKTCARKTVLQPSLKDVRLPDFGYAQKLAVRSKFCGNESLVTFW
jgi:hypothetical protein